MGVSDPGSVADCHFIIPPRDILWSGCRTAKDPLFVVPRVKDHQAVVGQIERLALEFALLVIAVTERLVTGMTAAAQGSLVTLGGAAAIGTHNRHGTLRKQHGIFAHCYFQWPLHFIQFF